MEETLTQQRRVGDEAFRSVKPCRRGRNGGRGNASALTVPGEEVPANSVPAAAVTRGERALFGFTGRKGCVGGSVSRV
jgi:hypothetical protein